MCGSPEGRVMAKLCWFWWSSVSSHRQWMDGLSPFCPKYDPYTESDCKVLALPFCFHGIFRWKRPDLEARRDTVALWDLLQLESVSGLAITDGGRSLERSYKAIQRGVKANKDSLYSFWIPERAISSAISYCYRGISYAAWILCVDGRNEVVCVD